MHTFPEKYFLITDYESMELMGVKGLFTKQKVDGQSLPDGFFKYSIREGEDPVRKMRGSRRRNRYMGDFVCQQELDLNGEDMLDSLDDYSYSERIVDLDGFFGVDIKRKIAEEIDAFYFDFDTYCYNDCIPSGCTREDVLESIYDGLNDKSYVDDMLRYLKQVLADNKEEGFLEPEVAYRVSSYVQVLTKVNSQNREAIDLIIDGANKTKENQGKQAQAQLEQG